MRHPTGAEAGVQNDAPHFTSPRAVLKTLPANKDPASMLTLRVQVKQRGSPVLVHDILHMIPFVI